ncbi:MAG: hypothetical protein AAFU79_08325 [Myxococcota bacterium]
MTMVRGKARSVLLAGLGSLWLAAAAGCDDDPRGERACITNQECSTGEICVGGSCIPEAEGCLSDFECAANEVCDLNSGACLPFAPLSCADDAACPAGERCNTAEGICIPGNRACESDASCERIGQVCDLAAQRCADCRSSSDCPAPASCIQGACVDSTVTSCRSDAECGAPEGICQDGRCGPACGRPGSPLRCGPDQICSPSTGRCTPAGAPCAIDVECGAPVQICEANQCVPGCASGGVCAEDEICNTATGRCQPDGRCRDDADCGPPDLVCEAGQCVGGCGAAIGIRCGAGETCSADTGRCEAPVTCTGDLDCAPPSTICDPSTLTCAPGCASTGCPGGETCDAASGRCQGAGAGLNAPCARNSDCGSGVCFDFGVGIGSLCVQACASSGDCPSGFTCGDYLGAKTCISSSFFPGATFATENGGVCAGDGECRSSYCLPGPAQCVDTCAEDGDCGGGTGSCVWGEYNADIFVSACTGPRLGTSSNGDTCTADADCQSGVCYGSGICGDLCGSTADCPASDICIPVDYSRCTTAVAGTCFQWQANFVKACVRADAFATGAGVIGSPCNQGGDCRDGICNVVDGVCTGSCSRDADCPSNMRCGIEEYGTLGSDPIFFNACVVP